MKFKSRPSCGKIVPFVGMDCEIGLVVEIGLVMGIGLFGGTGPVVSLTYMSQLIRFARASSHVTDFNNRNKFLTAKLLKQGYRYHKLRKAFSKFYRRHFELIEKFHASLKKLMQQGICNPEFYGDLVYKFKKIIGDPNFSYLLKRIVNPFKRAGIL